MQIQAIAIQKANLINLKCICYYFVETVCYYQQS